MRRFVMLLLAATALSAPVAAQEGSIDPRLVTPMVSAYRAQITLLEAALKASNDDAVKREADMAAWFKGWFGEKPAQ